MDLFGYMLAGGQGGGGGEAVQADWDTKISTEGSYIKNRPFYDDTVYLTNISLEPSTDSSPKTMNSVNLIVGQEYSVQFFSGEEQVCEITSITAFSGTEMSVDERIAFFEAYDDTGDYSLQFFDHVSVTAGGVEYSENSAAYFGQGPNIDKIILIGENLFIRDLVLLPDKFLNADYLSQKSEKIIYEQIFTSEPYDIQPTITETSLSSDFKDYRIGHVYKFTNFSSQTRTFQLSDGITTFSQVFTAPNGMSISYDSEVDFKIDGNNWEMRPAQSKNYISIPLSNDFSKITINEDRLLFSSSAENYLAIGGILLTSTEDSHFQEKVEGVFFDPTTGNYEASSSYCYATTYAFPTYNSQEKASQYRLVSKTEINLSEKEAQIFGQCFSYPTVTTATTVSQLLSKNSYNFGGSWKIKTTETSSSFGDANVLMAVGPMYDGSSIKIMGVVK